jgi:sec-independent protein translocase protein TatC
MPAPRSPNPAAEMPFLDHLEELRWRIIWSLAAILICGVVGFGVVLKWDVVNLLAQPMLKLLPSHKLIYTHPGDAFSITFNAAMIIAGVLAFPVVLYQVWSFLAPGLYQKERRVVVGVLFGGILLFVAGVALAFFVVLPLSLPWLMGFGGQALEAMITASDYFSFVFSLALTFGVSFELPILVLALAALGIVTPKLLNKYRRHAVVLIVFVGAFLTPGDMVWTTVALAVPLYGLYELSVVLSIMVYRRRQRRLMAVDAADVSDVGEASA